MFGYVRPYKSEMLVKEYEQYKAIYCELCRRLGKSYGILSRFALSYDCTFYALLALCVSRSQVHLDTGRCVMNPLKKCSYLPVKGEEYEKAAALCVILTYYKLKDDVEDGGRFSALRAKLLMALVSPKAKRAGKRYPFLEEIVGKAMEDQALAQKEKGGIDRCAHPTAQMLSELFRELPGCREGEDAALERFGYFLGRWIYLMDAADDLEEDLKTGSFNPFANRLGLSGKKELTAEERKRADEFCNEALNTTMAQMLPPFRLISLENFAPLVENVIEKGLPEMQREILFLHVNLKKKKREEML